MTDVRDTMKAELIVLSDCFDIGIRHVSGFLAGVIQMAGTINRTMKVKRRSWFSRKRSVHCDTCCFW